MAVKLSVMVEGLKWVCGHDTVYVNIKKNTLVNIADQSMSDLPSDHAILEIEENKDDYIELPSYKQIDFAKVFSRSDHFNRFSFLQYYKNRHNPWIASTDICALLFLYDICSSEQLRIHNLLSML